MVLAIAMAAGVLNAKVARPGAASRRGVQRHLAMDAPPLDVTVQARGMSPTSAAGLAVTALEATGLAVTGRLVAAESATALAVTALAVTALGVTAVTVTAVTVTGPVVAAAPALIVTAPAVPARVATMGARGA